MTSRLEAARGVVAAVGRLVIGIGGGAGQMVRRPLPVLSHVAIVVVSAAVAASLPFTFSLVAQRLLVYWAVVENERVFLVSAEVAVTLLLILAFNHARTNWWNRRLAKMARAAGMVQVTPGTGGRGRRATRRLKERQAFVRDIMLIGSTGFRTFVDPTGDLHRALQQCRTAKILLLDPESRGAMERARTIPDPELTQESLRRQVRQAIAFLGALRAAQKSVRLKLYPDPPFLKLALLGDHVWVQHYHPGLDVKAMPEYVFVDGQDPTSLYAVFYRYFTTRWNDPAVPEYDLVSDELVYRDEAGNEVRRHRLDAAPEPGARRVADGGPRRGRVGSAVARVISRWLPSPRSSADGREEDRQRTADIA